MPLEISESLKAKANYAAGLTTETNPWIVDSGATHHITTDPHNLQPYHGNEDVSMCDNNKIPISHTGSTKLNASNNVFKLTHTLRAPSIKLKLISVSKFVKTILSLLKFFLLTCCVDLKTRQSLVRGRTNNGLYEWPVSHPQAHIISTSSPLTTWHQRLGHPHSRVLRFILNKFLLLFHEREKISL